MKKLCLQLLPFLVSCALSVPTKNYADTYPDSNILSFPFNDSDENVHENKKEQPQLARATPTKSGITINGNYTTIQFFIREVDQAIFNTPFNVIQPEIRTDYNDSSKTHLEHPTSVMEKAKFEKINNCPKCPVFEQTVNITSNCDCPQCNNCPKCISCPQCDCPKCNCPECPKRSSPQIPCGFERLSVKTRDDDKYLVVIKSHNETLTWNEARRTCANEGGFLAYPTNAEETTLYKNTFPKDSVWVGIHDYFHTGQHTTILGEDARRVAYMNWRSDQPDNWQDKERCVHLCVGSLNDISCNSQYPFVCKIKLPIDT